jgi:hypothetical protein
VAAHQLASTAFSPYFSHAAPSKGFMSYVCNRRKRQQHSRVFVEKRVH